MGSPLDGCWIITRHRSAIWELSLGFELSFAAKTVAAIAGFFSLSTQELLLRPLRRDRQIWRNRATKARSGDDTQPVKLRYASDAGGQDAADRNAVLVPLFLARPDGPTLVCDPPFPCPVAALVALPPSPGLTRHVKF